MAAEKNFEIKVKKYLDECGAWYIKYWGGAPYTKSGIPDLLVSSNGQFLGIEIKADKGEPSLLQLHHLKKIRDSGGYGILLYPKDFNEFKKFNEHKLKSSRWYLSNVKEQHEWRRRLEERDERRTD